MKYISKISITVWLLLCLFTANAQDTLFIKANEHYSKAEFAQAIETYENLLNKNYQSASLYYNLGNAYYKSGQTAPAILNFERALRLKPRDTDITYNLELARFQVVDKIDELSGFFITSWLNKIIQRYSSNTWAYLSIGLFFLFLLSAAWFVFGQSSRTKKIGFLLGILLFLAFWAAVTCSYVQKKNMQRMDTAIIFNSSTTVHSTPSSSGTELFVLHEGTKVTILENIGEWYRIQIADGNDGWVEKDSFEII